MAESRTAKQAGNARVVEPAIDAAKSEHIYITSDEANPDPRTAGHTVRQRWRLNNPLRRVSTAITLYEEGYLEVIEQMRGRRPEPFRLDLQYLDPIPTISRIVAKRAWWVTAGFAAAAAASVALAELAVLGPLVISCALAAAAVALGALAVALHRSYEKTEFFTIHGRARVLVLVANFGALKPFRAFVPTLSRAIEEAAERITGETSAYLRAEMREHYRLRGDNVLSPEICAESTGRILAQFDIQL